GAPEASTACDPGTPTLHAAVVQVSSVAGMFAQGGATPSYILLTTLDGNAAESIRVASIDAAASPPTITACFSNPHAAGAVIAPMGGFATGIIPPTGMLNGSTDTKLKMYGDINGDGNMVFVEYTCDTTNHYLYRNVMAFDAGSKPAVTNSQILLSNIVDNPGGTACFTY